jgi:3-hydroxyacyl-CoA dehydrogenase/3a,7a,12a-trihydroxy-5b-cholest-24-enoyl-CoA hydratase
MVTGKADPMKLFTSGKLKIGGNVMASQKLDFLQKLDKNEVAKAMAERGGGGSGAAAGGAQGDGGAGKSPSGGGAAKAPVIFDKLGKRFADDPSLASQVGAVVQFCIKDPDADFIVDMTGKGAVLPGRAKDAAITLTLSDAHLEALANGSTDVRRLYQRGDLRIDGDIRIAHRLHFLEGLA